MTIIYVNQYHKMSTYQQLPSFYEINYDDVVAYLSFYQLSIPQDRDDAYKCALHLLLSATTQFAPRSISNFNDLYLQYRKTASKISYFDGLPYELKELIVKPLNARELSKLWNTLNDVNNFSAENMKLIKEKLSLFKLNFKFYDDETLFYISKYEQYNAIVAYIVDLFPRIVLILNDELVMIWPDRNALTGLNEDYSYQIKLPYDEVPKRVLCGEYYLFILSNLGNVYTLNIFERSDPKKIDIPEAIVDISTDRSNKYSAFLSQNGNVYVMNTSNCIVKSANISNIVGIVSGLFGVYTLDMYGNVYEFKRCIQQRKIYTNIRNILGNRYFVIAIDTENVLRLVNDRHGETFKGIHKLEPYILLKVFNTTIFYVNIHNQLIFVDCDYAGDEFNIKTIGNIDNPIIDFSVVLPKYKFNYIVKLVMILNIDGKDKVKYYKYNLLYETFEFSECFCSRSCDCM